MTVGRTGEEQPGALAVRGRDTARGEVARARRRRLSLRATRRLWLVVFLGPATALFALFVTYPILSALAYSLFAWEGIGRREFIGLGNFVRLVQTFPYPRLLVNAFWHNVLVFVLTMVVQNGTALGLALLLARDPWGARVYRVIFFLPVTLSLVIVGFLWLLFLNPVFGAVNKVLALAGVGHLARPWLGDPHTALVTLVLVNAWRWLGFPTLVFLAAIHAIPEEYLEAARIDGAGEGAAVRHVVLPLLAPAVTIIVLLTFLGAFNWFELPYVMQGVAGAPDRATDVLGLLFYRTAFGEVDTGLQDIGIGSAIAVLMFALLGSVSAVAAVLLRRREVEYA
ncbi:MAG: sugar ABC transporter permease [Armatimonadota bacterium]|nr:sugar ABC transporter permease [Armatimonadota bacterium]MDR7448692.1 sugar ABC transporter permease [Armatimonadota bacterium]MDR7460745.1 sugar ABC transporter permease [Armatimonadota bacterium]MDR7479034.1 sugar ABC transporter permease [Armatimonadota bacterium]MDR7488972.1 sugar ABC transporter permease [Armatimonadota bacterium]